MKGTLSLPWLLVAALSSFYPASGAANELAPLRVGEHQRFLVRASGKPFFWLRAQNPPELV